MKSIKTITLAIVTCIFLLLTSWSCKDQTPKPNSALASIDLKRGDLLLCRTESLGR